MLALYNFVPLYCLSCSTPTRLDCADNALSGKYQAYQTQPNAFSVVVLDGDEHQATIVDFAAEPV